MTFWTGFTPLEVERHYLKFLCLFASFFFFFIAAVNIIIKDHSWEPVLVPHMPS